ncbi:hypothetical protein SFC88_13520 [Nocardioides sp. HM23]|uniref:hypothetical protein n=1 Tax=Nocardioides bizhenqiangii TaxID=3095076 RepID=UPI002ACAB574|nr:hypothetical protein [Nocardioides sp. HM23]MDZ5621860.1 hypothetical protein [Nocardioides sp. HM23]
MVRSMLAAGAAALFLSACSGDDGSASGGTDDPEPIDDVCALLPPEDATRIVGASYLRAREPAPDLPFRLCSYRQSEDEAPFTLTVSAGEGDLDQVVRGLEMYGEVSEQPIDVPGADDAVVLSTDDGDLAIEQVAAEADGNAYVVTFGGSTEVAVRLLSATLGEDAVDHSGAPVPDVCVLDPQVTSVLGRRAEREAGPAEEAWSSCSWETGTGTSATLSTARDAGDLDRYLAEHGYVPEGVTPQPIQVPGADAALLVRGPAATVSQASGLAQVGPVIYEVEVDDPATGRAAEIARELLAAAIGSS